MTREEAIANLNMISVAFVEPVTKEQRKLIDDTFDMAIKALEQEASGDVISRQAVIDALTKTSGIRGDALKALYDLPPVNPQEPKTGHWNCGDDMFEYAICSSCKHETGEAWEYAKRNFKYCPNCGCAMKGE